MKDIHTIAERYLQDIESGKSFYAPADNVDILMLGDSLTERVIITREQSPPYLAGIKPSGRPIFTHDMKLAAAYDSASMKLVDILSRLKMYDMHVETMPACWFSNFHG